jgi:hypothetical protein
MSRPSKDEEGWPVGFAKCAILLCIAGLKNGSATDIVRPIREIVRRREETTAYSVQTKWD